jgi:hypothetical protein
MQNTTMYEYQSYLLHTYGESEREAQRDLKYCDGSMQTYLERMFRKEHPLVQAIIFERVKNKCVHTH